MNKHFNAVNLIRGASVATMAMLSVNEANAGPVSQAHQIFINDTDEGVVKDRAGYLRDDRTGEYIGFNQGPLRSNEENACVWKQGPQGDVSAGWQVTYTVVPHPRADANSCCSVGDFNSVAAVDDLIAKGLDDSTVTPSVTRQDADVVRVNERTDGCSRPSSEGTTRNNGGSSDCQCTPNNPNNGNDGNNGGNGGNGLPGPVAYNVGEQPEIQPKAAIHYIIPGQAPRALVI